jgi:hypothetical protein
VATDLHLRPRSHWDWLMCYSIQNNFINFKGLTQVNRILTTLNMWARRRCGNTLRMTSVFNGLNLHRTDSEKYQVTVSQFHCSFMHRISCSKNSEYDQFSRHYRSTFITTHSLLVTYSMQSQVHLWYLPHTSHLYLQHLKANHTS